MVGANCLNSDRDYLAKGFGIGNKEQEADLVAVLY